MAEPIQVLSVGSVVGGPTPQNQRWREGITELTRAVVRSRDAVESPLNVNVVFHVPGSMLQPDFDGVRTGRFKRDANLLMVQVALPAVVPVDVRGTLRDALKQAIGVAEEWAIKRKVAVDLAALRSLVGGL
jgi:hypothetical protein